MSTTELIATIARPAIRLGLSATQVPFSLAERIAGQQGNDEWPPAVAFQGLQATVLQASGSLLHDDQLTAQGRLLAEKLERLEKADLLESQAAAQLRQADERHERERAEADRLRTEAAEAAEHQRTVAARRERDRKRKAQEQADAATADAAKAQADAKKRAERERRRNQTKAITVERQALAKEKAAAAAARKAAAADQAIEAS